MSKTLCIFHANCADGLGAAWAVYRALGPDVEFVAAKYGDQPQLSEPCKYHSTTEPCTDCLGTGYELGGGPFLDRDVLIVDFSYPLPTLRAMAKEARSVLVLDHHKTAQEDLMSIPPPPKQGDWREWLAAGKGQHDNLATIFDLNRSGAGLAWDYLHPASHDATNPFAPQETNIPEFGGQNKPRPHIINLIEDRDLWKFQFGDETRAFHAVLTSYDWTDLPAMFKQLDKWWEAGEFAHGNYKGIPHTLAYPTETWNTALSDGRAILRANAQAVERAVVVSRRTIKIAGYTVPCANVPGAMASDAGHLLGQLAVKDLIAHRGPSADSSIPHGPTFSATYYDGADRRHFSLRSPDGGADVGAIARQMAEQLNETAAKEIIEKYGTAFFNGFAGGGHEHAAGFDAPIGWEGE